MKLLILTISVVALACFAVACKPVAIYDNKGKLTSVGSEWIETAEPGAGENIINATARGVDQGTNLALDLLGNPIVIALLGGGGLGGLLAVKDSRARKREDALFDEGVRRGANGEIKPN